MHASVQKLHTLLADLKAHDLALMSKEADAHLRASVTTRFVDATGGLQTLFLGAHAEIPRWLWKAELADSFGNEWIATYNIVDTGMMESAIGQHEKIRMAAAFFPGLVLTVDVFAAYHHPGGTGLQVDPKITVRLTVSGDPELALVEHFLDLAHDHFPQSGNGLSVSVQPRENCCDEIENPESIHQAFRIVARAARSAARASWGDDETTMTENIDLIVAMDDSVEASRMQEAFSFFGLMFTSVVTSQG